MAIAGPPSNARVAIAGPPSNARAALKTGALDAPGGGGADFWLISPADESGGASSVLLACDSDAEGSVSIERAGFEKKFHVGVGRAASVELPAAFEGDSKGESGIALHVTASSPVSAVVRASPAS